ncbi:hypothetical protein ACFSJU_05550 [Paradesertivirga mongoliensis]|uniref:Long-chain fatty acid transport protein n=1 Tax=Paradesertivirga mongoliensis TaxID=2100740 RepID=A0ABW4ZJ29_9SPHI|nr:hypothetical protein [Pedobacter mongoliensis]
MTRILKNIIVAIFLLGGLQGFSQSTTSSPYSQYGIGNLNGSQLPQNRSMGGISAGLRKPSLYNNINLANPASYSAIRITTFDIGVFGSQTNLSKGEISEKTFDASLNHLVFGIPVTKTSALSFGLVPYSSKGYNFTDDGFVNAEPVNYVYSANGGISKAYLGYGFKIGSRLSVGANASFLFGKLTESKAAEYEDVAFLNSRTQSSTSISGLTFDYGVQYEAPVNSKVSLILGYSGSSNSKVRSKAELLTTRYYKDINSGVGGVSVDTTEFKQNDVTKIQLPMMHTIGFAFQRPNKWLIGADVSLGQWKNYSEGGVNGGLQNSTGIAIGGQVTPDISSVGNYFNIVDYRFGFKYDKTYINLQNQDIKQMAFTFGLGLPLPANRSTFYKINFGTELGQRGSLKNNLVRERYVNLFLSFTMNDQWFQKYKFD